MNQTHTPIRVRFAYPWGTKNAMNALAYADSSTNLEWQINFGGDQQRSRETAIIHGGAEGVEELTLPSEEL